jgi:hypothetical protein
MKIKYWVISIFCAAALLNTPAFAQSAPVFSSVYTDLRKDCKDAWRGRDRQHA